MIAIGENVEYVRVIEQANRDKIDWGYRMHIIPVNFAKDHKSMLFHLQSLLSQNYLQIDKNRFDKLVSALYSAQDVEGKLDKQVTVHNDILDALRLSLQEFKVD